MSLTPNLSHRLATLEDIPALTDLMNLSIGGLQNDVLTPKQVEASYECMGLDSQLVKDKTYLVIEENGEIAGCGGWSYRETLFGGNEYHDRDAARLDPKTQPARIMAMYTHPNFTRRGVGRLIMELCEAEAKKAGFTRTEMAATLSGEPLYRACGYETIENFVSLSSKGIKVPLIRMGKKL